MIAKLGARWYFKVHSIQIHGVRVIAVHTVLATRLFVNVGANYVCSFVEVRVRLHALAFPCAGTCPVLAARARGITKAHTRRKPVLFGIFWTGVPVFFAAVAPPVSDRNASGVVYT